jgi:hypothetical protein
MSTGNPPPSVLNYSTFADPGGFRDSSDRAKRAILLLWIGIASSAIGFMFSAWVVVIIAQSGPLDPAKFLTSAAGILTMLFGLLSTAVSITGFVLLLMWQHRAYSNLRPLGQSASYTPGWAVGYWFIPIINLFRPYRVYRELLTPSGDSKPVTNLVGWWWLTFIGSCIVSIIASVIEGGINENGPIIAAVIRTLVILTLAFANYLLILLIQRIVALQNVR